MTFQEYQEQAIKTALPTALCREYLLPGLLGEIGELAGKVAKAVRDQWTPEKLREGILAEGGDCLWFCALIAHVEGVEHVRVGFLNLTYHPKITKLAKAHIELNEAIYSGQSFRYELDLMATRILQFLHGYGISAEEAYTHNLSKLASRQQRGTLEGEGDVR